MFRFTPIVLSLALAACGGGGGGSTTGSIDSGSMNSQSSSSSSKPTTTPSIVWTDKDLKVTGDYQSATINKTARIGVTVDGDYNKIYVQTSIAYLDISGDYNDIEISNGVTIDECNVIGDYNEAIKNKDLKFACNVSGSYNKGFN